MIPQMPTFHDFGDRRGDATQAEFVARVHQELYAARVGSVSPPLTSQDGPLGLMIGLARDTLDLRRFVLAGDLAAGGSASAYAIGYDFSRAKARSQFDTIIVYDPFGVSGGPQVGKTGEYGWACWQEDAGRWEVVSMVTANSNDDFFLAYLDSRTLTSGVYVYGWTEYEVAATATLPTSKSGGRSGTSAVWSAVEINNRAVATGTLVWMRRAYKGSQAKVVITKSTVGNNEGQPAVFRLYVSNASGGTYTITWNSSTTSAIAYNANAATVKSAIEAAVSGLTLNAFTGSGTSADPWIVSASSTAADVDGRANGDSLKDAGGYAFAAPGGAWTFAWTATKTSNYTASVWDAIPCNISGGAFTVTLPALSSSPVGSMILIETLLYAGTNYVIVAPNGTDKINGSNSSYTMVDSGLNPATENNAGGAWVFVRSDSSDTGWACLRYLKPISPG